MIRTRKLAFYIKWLLFAFVITEVLVLGYNLLTVQHSKNILLRSEEKNGTEQNGTCKKEKPDIFFIVFDEYTSTEGLAKYMNFDNKRIDSLFTANGFYLASGSRSNYNMTVFSLSSTLNYTYLDLKKTDNVISPKKILQGAETFKKNRLTSFLAGEGYEIINLGCLELENSVIHTIPFFDHMQGELINNQTFFSHLNRDIGWKFRIKNIFSGKPRIPSVHKEEKKRHISRNDFNEVQLINALNAEDDQPRFVYAHLMLPHDPFYFDSSGNLVSDTLILQGKLNREEAYISQLKYCNKILEKMIRSSVKKNNRERVVVIEGDHGFGYHDDPKKAEREFSNLNALYFSDLDYQGLYPTISPVNTFRLVLNKYFCFNLPLLTDSCFFMQQKK